MGVGAEELEEDGGVRVVCVSLVDLYALAINSENRHREWRGRGRGRGRSNHRTRRGVLPGCGKGGVVDRFIGRGGWVVSELGTASWRRRMRPRGERDKGGENKIIITCEI